MPGKDKKKTHRRGAEDAEKSRERDQVTGGRKTKSFDLIPET